MGLPLQSLALYQSRVLDRKYRLYQPVHKPIRHGCVGNTLNGLNRRAAALALSKDENAPTASPGAPYKDAGTQVDTVMSTAKASGAGDDCVLIEKKVLASFQKLSISLSYFISLFLSFSLFPTNQNVGGSKKTGFFSFQKQTLLTLSFFFSRKKKKKKQTVVNKPRDKPIVIKGADKELPSTRASEQAVPSLFERKAAKKSTEQARQQQQHVEEEPRNGRPLQLLKNQHRHELKSNNNDGRLQPPKNQNNPPVDPRKPASTKNVQNITSPAATTELRASAAAPKAIINPIKNQAASKPTSKNIIWPKVPNWFQMLQPPPSKKQS